VTNPLEADAKWKDEVIDLAVVNWSYRREHEAHPKLALADILKTEIQMALDPTVSKEAEALQKVAFEAGWTAHQDATEWATPNDVDGAYAAWRGITVEEFDEVTARGLPPGGHPNL
jgi:hypothetical protein